MLRPLHRASSRATSLGLPEGATAGRLDAMRRLVGGVERAGELARASHGPSALIAHAAGALADALAAPVVRDCLAMAAHAFETGEDEAEGLEAWVACVVRARVVLGTLPRGGGWGALHARLRALDRRLVEHRAAVMLLAPEEYADAIRGTDADDPGWWLARQRIGWAVTDKELEDAMRAIARKQRRGTRTVEEP